jgi:nucleoside-diphosphate-sugar epimerase
MPRVLIAGLRYVGKATAELFHNAGWQVEGWTHSARSAEESASLPYPVRACDIADADTVAAASSAFDVVVQCVSSGGGNAEDYRRVYYSGARNLRDCFRDARLVFTSSTSVYAQTDGACVTESSPAEPSRDTGRILRETEQLVLDAGGIVARLGGIIGPGRSFLLRKYLAGDATIDAAGERYLNQVHRNDIAAALFLLGTIPAVEPPRIFNVVDDEPMTQRACYDWLARHFGGSLPPAVAGQVRKRGNSNKRVSNGKLRGLGWRPMYPSFREAMERSIIPQLPTAGA